VPRIRPLRALRFGSDHLEQLELLVSPATAGEPEDRTQVGDVHHNNIRQLVRGDRGELAGPEEPPFTHAARLLDRWKQDAVLVRDPRPSTYVYGQQGAGPERRSLVCLVRLDPEGAGPILPHERTGGGSADQLLAQLRATRSQLSLVMALVPDASGVLADYLAGAVGRPSLEAVDGAGRLNRIWRDEDPGRHSRLIAALQPEIAVIADGHNRHQAATRYRDEQHQLSGGRRERPHDYIMMALVPIADAGLRCEPTHRVCPRLEGSEPAVLDGLERLFTVLPLDGEGALQAFLADGASIRFGMARGEALFGLELRESPDTSQLLGALPESLRSVESAVLDLVLNERLKDSVGASGSSGSSWGHNRSSASDIIAASREGQLDLAFVLRATPPEQVLAVARDSLLMPPKSTNFSPKPTKGLLMNSLVSF